MSPPGTSLPILERRADIEDALRRHQVVVICGETGSGKTTQLPQICLEMLNAGSENAARGPGGIIGHTQPRRIAARAVAARIAEERGVALGGLVGVKIRFQDRTGPTTRIKVMTDGILLAELSSDPLLRAYRMLIIDEAHERSLNIDFILGYLRHLLPARPDLKVIVTSATIDPRRFSDYFGGPELSPVIEVSGRTYPVEVRYRPVRAVEEEFERVEFEAVADAVEELCGARSSTGDVLVFLPGEREIRLAGDAIARRRVDADVLPLFSRLTNQEQDRIFHPGRDGRARVILATNVAETSLTVPGIRYVVDTGLARVSRFDPERKIGRLPVEPISQASANQRSGRCGRIAAGICVRLYSEASYRARPSFTEAEIRRTSLAGVILRMKSLGDRLGAIEDFPFLDPPGARAIEEGYETLFELGAIETAGRDGKVTRIGEQMARMPLDPRIARMLLGGEREGALDEVIVLAAVLSIQDPRERPASRQEEADRAQSLFRHDGSDFLTLLRLWEQYHVAGEAMGSGALGGWCREHFLSGTRMLEWRELVHQLRDVATELGLKANAAPAKEDSVHRALLTGLISNVACREGDGSFDYRGVRGNVVQIFPGSALFRKGPPWIMAGEIVQTTRLYARTVARIDPTWMEDLAGHMLRRQLSDPHFDANTGEPSVWERVTMSGIVVVPRRRAALSPADPPKARKIFLREALARCRWSLDAPFMHHNREMLERARSAGARLRRRDVAVSEDEVVAWFEKRVAREVCDTASFNVWRVRAEEVDPAVLMLAETDLVGPSALRALDEESFPEHLELGSGAARASCPVEYVFAPSTDEDGVTVTVGLKSLPEMTVERAEWLVPGLLPDLVHGLIKTLPKARRSEIEGKGALSQISGACAGVMVFGVDPLAEALSDALDALYGIKIEPGAWQMKSLPGYLRMRIRVLDEIGQSLAAERDLASLHKRFESRVRKARASQDVSEFEREGLTTWDCGAIPEKVEIERDGLVVTVFPALVDAGATASLTLFDSAREASLHHVRGTRRLFAIASREEVGYYLDALPHWKEMKRQFANFGGESELRDQLTSVIAERTFLEGQPAVRTREEFAERSEKAWGRLSTMAREVGETAANILAPRARVAQRIAGGTPRQWAASIADLREQSAYLLTREFLALVPWERLRHYPRYTEGMRHRLFELREEGSGPELAALQKFEPHWKKFTAWVAAAISGERARSEAEGAASAPSARTKGGPLLPQTRRTAPKVNVDAAEWAMRPGKLPPAVEQYRWALEELRLTIFAPALGAKVTVGDVEKLWAAV